MFSEKDASEKFWERLDTSTPGELRLLFVTMSVQRYPMVHILNDVTCHVAMMMDIDYPDPRFQEYMLLKELESLLIAKYPVGKKLLSDYGLTDPDYGKYIMETESYAEFESDRDDYEIENELMDCEGEIDEWLECEGIDQLEHLEVEKRIWKGNNSDV